MGEVKTRCLLLAMILWLAIPSALRAQEFSVASFRQLPNDVSAFINNVRDLNDEACALIKVVAPSDFAFSSLPRHREAKGRSGRNLALSAERHQDPHPETSRMGRVARLPAGQTAGEPNDLRDEAQPAQASHHGLQ